ncbi:sporulenol synthase [Aneurinibacillus soli]|uniref:Sporulenol synthase n=1 Tax=Aneurinibacillus soli TaxID=1500254 RepID=A0A0U5B0G7_9BACL|nr:sporulenol synthase [Aneurinibacillus soli]BAU27744.1 Sporulenol synthase [Aneurinibacillus soli]
MNQIETEIHRIIATVKRQQAQAGSWYYCLESGPMIDAYMIILLRTLNIHDEDFIRSVTEAIIDKQEPNGAWKLFRDEEGGNLSATIEAYDALLFSGHARVHIAPILITSDRKFSLKTERTPDVSDLYMKHRATSINIQHRSLLSLIASGIQQLSYLPEHIHNLATRRAEQFMLDRIEPDGTLYSYFSATFLMIFALLALGYSERHPIIVHAITGLQTLSCKANGRMHVQNSTSTVWDTALVSYALQEAGVPYSSTTIQRAGHYLLSRQQTKYGDWIVHNPNAAPGGWGFSDSNTIDLDVDDTTAALRAIHKLAKTNPIYRQAWERGVSWVLSMQNDDGGWPAFEKNTDKEILRMLPISGTESVSTDPSTADLTGRTLQFLGADVGLHVQHPNIRRGVHWILKNQQEDGSWYGRWGESCRSDVVKKYVPLGASTLSQTAWAVDALVAVSKETTPAIERGIQYLLDSGNKTDWTTAYPTGAGLPGGFYFYYHSYRYIWPLLALSHYKEKFT